MSASPPRGLRRRPLKCNPQTGRSYRRPFQHAIQKCCDRPPDRGRNGALGLCRRRQFAGLIRNHGDGVGQFDLDRARSEEVVIATASTSCTTRLLFLPLGLAAATAFCGCLQLTAWLQVRLGSTSRRWGRSASAQFAPRTEELASRRGFSSLWEALAACVSLVQAAGRDAAGR